MQSDWHSDALDSRLALRITAALIELKHHPIYMDRPVRCAYIQRHRYLFMHRNWERASSAEKIPAVFQWIQDG
jgi:hypothetical protein